MPSPEMIVQNLESTNRERCLRLVALRRAHPAWQLLASRNGPLVLSCLADLFGEKSGGIPQDDAVERLADFFAAHANDSDFDVGDQEDHFVSAKRELRAWIRRKLIVEREGQLLATDALEQCRAFLVGIEERAMTSTASRLSTVQREIENLELQLNGDRASRTAALREKISGLNRELEAAEKGDFVVLEGPRAAEGLREVYQLATSLRADFRRVEDSYREADLALRQRIVGERQNRGEIVDELLAGHAALFETQEGQVFESFHQQLVQSADLERMKQRIRAILGHAVAETASVRRQRGELSRLVPSLVAESARVIQARARGERDVRAFMKSGLADEQLRVGAVLHDIFEAALDVDWPSQKVRRVPSPLPPVAIATPNLPLVERLLVKEAGGDAETDLDFSVRPSDPTDLGAEFWQAYHALDRAALFQATLDHLKASGKPSTLGELAGALPPTHDLETLSYWLAMARVVGIELRADEEIIDLKDDEDGKWTRFHVPFLELTHEALDQLGIDDVE